VLSAIGTGRLFKSATGLVGVAGLVLALTTVEQDRNPQGADDDFSAGGADHCGGHDCRGRGFHLRDCHRLGYHRLDKRHSEVDPAGAGDIEGLCVLAI
jgi:hypothetical protein